MSEPTIDEEIELALGSTTPWAIHAIRVDERRRLAKLLQEHAGTIGEFTVDTEGAVKIVAVLIGLEGRP